MKEIQWEFRNDDWHYGVWIVSTKWPIVGRWNVLVPGCNEYFCIEDFETLEEAKEFVERPGHVFD